MFIDIEQDNTSKYTVEELLGYAHKGLLVCNGVDISDFILRIKRELKTDYNPWRIVDDFTS